MARNSFIPLVLERATDEQGGDGTCKEEKDENHNRNPGGPANLAVSKYFQVEVADEQSREHNAGHVQELGRSLDLKVSLDHYWVFDKPVLDMESHSSNLDKYCEALESFCDHYRVYSLTNPEYC